MFLTESTQLEPKFQVTMIILFIIVMLPWVYVIFRFGIFRRLRVRFILSNDQELPYVMLKKGAAIPLPVVNMEGYDFAGWFLDEEYTKPYQTMPMPDKNIKLYGKLIKK